MPNYVIAHDLGATGNKATLYDREGHLVGAPFQGYNTNMPTPARRSRTRKTGGKPSANRLVFC